MDDLKNRLEKVVAEHERERGSIDAREALIQRLIKELESVKQASGPLDSNSRNGTCC